MISEEDFGVREEIPGQGLAIAAEALFLLNLLALPGLAFAILAGLWFRFRHDAPPLARQHLRQAFVVSLWGGVLIVVCSAGILLAGGLHEQWTWVVLILYFTCIHSTLILLGMVALVKAMGGQGWRFPVIGPKLDCQP
ncbi:hypothetical protein [Dechloromonas sp.]|uniref:hypothetical protein n=1 Tax=Dechloromonas sp. TaxID=1917218 RepID=UPI00121DCCEB|nr:hypothetical protein [Dechloromonas sp.]MBU3695517.1 hypothetical protein [Dechloromonas sp.]TEX48943.1 MAG: hypothetical protein CFR70_04940 [Rhodocyclaceae bacterium]